MKEIHWMIVAKLKEEYEVKGTDADGQRLPDDDVWVMAAAAIPFQESPETRDFLPYHLEESESYGSDEDQKRQFYQSEATPTHIVRVVVRTGGTDWVDGTDVYMVVDEEGKSADFVWTDVWEQGPPKYEAGSVEHSLAWIRQMAEPFYVQLESPFAHAHQSPKMYHS